MNRVQVGEVGSGRLRFLETELAGAFVVEPRIAEDERGYFCRVWCDREARAVGLDVHWVQSSASYNRLRGTLRGMHWQAAPHQEDKLVRCVAGAIYDVIIDLRPDSPTYLSHFATELSAENRRMLFVPRGFAHGFQTLHDETTVDYRMSDFFAPHSGRGVRWNDPAFGITWPVPDPILNERDRTHPDFDPDALPEVDGGRDGGAS